MGEGQMEVEMEPIDNDKRQSCRSTLTYKDSDKENYWGVGERR